MWDYTGKVKDHFKNPRNVGYIEDHDGIGEVGSLACGDALQLTFKLDSEKKRIEDVKFRTFGCASAIASSSALTELIRGKTLAEAAEVTNQDIADYLGGLPDQKMHCSVMGKEALEAAIENYKTGGTVKKELDSKVICKCYGITEKEIERVVRENRLTTVEEVTNYTKAGGGCGGCLDEIQRVLDSVNGETAVSEEKEPAAPPRPMTNLEKIQRIQDALENQVKPLLAEHGGSLELIDVDGDRVIIRFTGSCAQCRVAEFTMGEVVEKRLREFVSPDIIVEEKKS